MKKLASTLDAEPSVSEDPPEASPEPTDSTLKAETPIPLDNTPDQPKPEDEKKPEEPAADESAPSEDFFQSKSENCLKESPNTECLKKNIEEKTAHLLDVFSNLYAPIELICRQSESVCIQILDGLRKFEEFRPKTKRAELLPIMKNKVEQIGQQVEKIGIEKLEIQGQANIDALDDRIWEAVESIKKDAESDIEKFENREEMESVLVKKSTFVLKMVIVKFYLDEYLPSQKVKVGGEGEDEESGHQVEGKGPKGGDGQAGTRLERSLQEGENLEKPEEVKSGEGKINLVQLDINSVNLEELMDSLKKIKKSR